jgi:hypothetical protein
MEVKMADYPCDLHLARYKGPSTRAFLNLYRDNDQVALRASVCGDCLADLVSAWIPRALAKTAEGYWDPLEDDQPLESLWRPQTAVSGYRNGRGGH